MKRVQNEPSWTLLLSRGINKGIACNMQSSSYGCEYAYFYMQCHSKPPSFMLHSCLMDTALVFCGCNGLMNIWHGLPEQLLWAFLFCYCIIHVELSNDGINGIFDLVITVDKKCFVYSVVLKRQIRPENYYYFLFNIKANIENILWLEERSKVFKK